MKNIKLLIGLVVAFTSINAHAFWGGNNDFFGGNGWGNNWPVWTPMYWMEEFTGDNNYNDYYGNANPWSAAPLNNMPFTNQHNGNPWGQNGVNANFPPNGYSPYIGGRPNAGYPAGYPQGYRPLSGFQNMPLVPSRGPTSFR